MSKNEKDTEKKEQAQEQAEKYVSNYDRKKLMREQQKAKAKREELTGRIIGTVIVAALVCLVAYFPIRNYRTVNGTYIKVNGESVSRVEFDYYYNMSKNNFISQYYSYLQYFGMDPSQDLATQAYSDTLSWKDYFEQMAVDSITTQKALNAAGKAAGFVYDTSDEYKEFKTSIEEAAQSSGTSVRKYVQQSYGSYATLGRIKNAVETGIYANAYYNHVSDEKAATDEQIESYYEENKSEYDSVDYYMTTINAELPTEPTELADPVEETDGEETSEDEVYQPSDAEIEKAMADAKVLADEAVASVVQEGELQENKLSSDSSYLITDWLFDESRKEGDTTVIEDSTSYQYFVLSFVKRYRDDSPLADVRIILPGEEDGQAILDEWKSGEATEASFIELADKYNADNAYFGDGGLYESVPNNGSDNALSAWIYDESRKTGDAAFISTEEGGNYVVYYIGASKPKWMVDIANTLLSDTMDAYLAEICEAVEVEDPKGHLNYLKVQAEEEAAEDTVSDSDAE